MSGVIVMKKYIAYFMFYSIGGWVLERIINLIFLGGWVDKVEGQLFTELKQFEDSDLTKPEMVLSCIDVADQGKDYLCQII